MRLYERLDSKSLKARRFTAQHIFVITHRSIRYTLSATSDTAILISSVQMSACQVTAVRFGVRAVRDRTFLRVHAGRSASPAAHQSARRVVVPRQRSRRLSSKSFGFGNKHLYSGLSYVGSENTFGSGHPHVACNAAGGGGGGPEQSPSNMLAGVLVQLSLIYVLFFTGFGRFLLDAGIVITILLFTVPPTIMAVATWWVRENSVSGECSACSYPVSTIRSNKEFRCPSCGTLLALQDDDSFARAKPSFDRDEPFNPFGDPMQQQRSSQRKPDDATTITVDAEVIDVEIGDKK